MNKSSDNFGVTTKSDLRTELWVRRRKERSFCRVVTNGPTITGEKYHKQPTRHCTPTLLRVIMADKHVDIYKLVLTMDETPFWTINVDEERY